MSDFTVFLDDIKKWVARPDWSNELVTSFVRMAETTLTQVMRVREMIQISTALIDSSGRAELPPDWEAMDYVRKLGGKPYVFKTKHDFLNMDETAGHYTIVGNFILFGGSIDANVGQEVEISYYQSVPQMTDTTNWLHTHYYNIFLMACCAPAALYAEEYERSTMLETTSSNFVVTANSASAAGQISGSVLKRGNIRRIG